MQRTVRRQTIPVLIRILVLQSPLALLEAKRSSPIGANVVIRRSTYYINNSRSSHLAGVKCIEFLHREARVVVTADENDKQDVFHCNGSKYSAEDSPAA